MLDRGRIEVRVEMGGGMSVGESFVKDTTDFDVVRVDLTPVGSACMLLAAVCGGPACRYCNHQVAKVLLNL